MQCVKKIICFSYKEKKLQSNEQSTEWREEKNGIQKTISTNMNIGLHQFSTTQKIVGTWDTKVVNFVSNGEQDKDAYAPNLIHII